MGDQVTNVDNFFAHYGVRGMKWGKRKQARVTLREARGAALVNKSKGKVGRAVAVSLGKDFLTKGAVNYGSLLVATLAKDNLIVRQGAGVVGSIFNVATTVKTANDLVDIHAHVNRDK